MKKFNLLLSLLFTVVSLQAQDFQISFAGTGESTQVGTVTVENLTQGKRLTLNGTEILHLVATITGINPVPDNDSELRIYPNPTNGTSTINFYASNSGKVNTELFDITGKRVVTAQNIINKGIQAYQISNLQSGIYIIRITSQSYNFTGKLVSNGIANSEVKVNYIGNVIIPDTSMKLKSVNAELEMQYTEGDRLKITGTSGKCSTVITDVPTQSKSITFPFVTCTDGDGNNYPVVQIGTQLWMGENLKTTKYLSGESIPNVTDSIEWSNLTTGAYSNYNNDAAIGDKYGKLYNWYAITDKRNIAPTGWHVATDSEWTALENYVDTYMSTFSSQAKALAANTSWPSSINADAVGNDLTKNNISGFTALPGGVHDYDGAFYRVSIDGFWWVYTEDIARGRVIFSSSTTVYRNIDGIKECGFSVRCVKD